MFSIPENSDDWAYFFVGAYAATGIPVMAMAMGTIAGLVVENTMSNDFTAQLAEDLEQEVLYELFINDH